MDIYQVALHADDLDRAANFYSGLLGAEPSGRFEPPGLLFFQVGATRLLLERNAPGSMIYIRVVDLIDTVEKLRRDGVEIVSEPHPIFTHQDDSLGPVGTAEWQAFVRDSENNLVGLIAHTPSPGNLSP